MSSNEESDMFYCVDRLTEKVIEETNLKRTMIRANINVGPYGYVKFLDFMGSDESIVESARQSYNMGDAELDRDTIVRMIHTMTKNGHSSPFEQAVIKLKIKAPIFVLRQFMRHRTASINESSMRYTVSSGEYFKMDEETQNARSNIIGFENTEDDHLSFNDIEKLYEESCEKDFETYNALLKTNVPKELARACLPLSTYSEIVWSMDMNNLKKMLNLRLDVHAQQEIRYFAIAIAAMAYQVFPVTLEAFFKHQYFSTSINASDIFSIYRAEDPKIKLKSLLDSLVKKYDNINKLVDSLSQSNSKLLDKNDDYGISELNTVSLDYDDENGYTKLLKNRLLVDLSKMLLSIYRDFLNEK